MANTIPPSNTGSTRLRTIRCPEADGEAVEVVIESVKVELEFMFEVEEDVADTLVDGLVLEIVRSTVSPGITCVGANTDVGLIETEVPDCWHRASKSRRACATAC